MNDGLHDAFGHNAWATRELLLMCRQLTDAQTHAAAPGTYGSIIATLWHTVSSKAGYCARLTGEEAAWDRRADAAPRLEKLTGYVDDLSERWVRFLAHPFDAERIFSVKWHDGRDYNVPAGIVLAQVLHHGSEHRAQICAALTSTNVTAPDLGLWDFAEATRRAKPHDS